MEKNRKKHHSILHTCLNSALALAMFLSPITSIVAEDTSMPVSTEAPAETAVPAEEPAAEEQVVTAEAPAEEPVTEPAEEAVPVQETEPAATPAPMPAATPAPTPAPTPAAVPTPTATADAALVTEETAAPVETVVPEETPAASAAAEASETPEPSATPEATASPEPEEPEYLPAGAFTGSTSQMTVTVSYGEETFKTGTEMKVAYVSRSEAIAAAEQTASEDQEVIDAMAVDITFIDSDGNEVQPEGAVSVSLEPRRALASTETSTQEVLHKEDNGNVQVVGNADVSAAGAEFSADHFSIYVISSKDSPAIATYHFYDAAGNEIAGSAQKVKSGETVYAPTTPEKTGSKFLGWSYTQNAAALQEGDPGDFNQITASVRSAGDVNLYPVFQQAYYVFFLDNQGRVSTTKEGASGAVIEVSDVTIPLDSTHSVTGWYTDAELTSKVGSVTLSDHNVTLYPKVEEGHYLYFSSGDGASYVKPVFVAANHTTAEPEAPVRPGYTFSHWSAAAGGSKYSFGSQISEDTTLYAVWEANSDTEYTVIFWKQSVNDSKDAADDAKTYDYAESVTRTGMTGSDASPKYEDQNKGYTGFSYNSPKSASVTIKGDGTTILNVYYDRNLLTINFYTWQRNGRLGGKWSLYNSFTGLYGQTLAQNGYTWPSNYKWYTQKDNYGYTGGTNITFLDAFISDDYANYGSNTTLNLYGSDEGGSRLINHYKQNLDGSYSYDSPANSTKSNPGTFTFTNKYTGFTINSYFTGLNTPNDYSRWNSASAGSSTQYRNNLYVRYTRNSYHLAYYNYNGVVKKESLLYEASLNSYSSYVPDRPAGLPEAYTFQGWFKDKECTVPFDFDSTMPANDVMIYAKWAAPAFDGTIHTNIEGTGTRMEIRVNYGGKINENDMPTVKDTGGNVIQKGNGSYTVTVPAGYTWAGWATKSGDDYTIYNFNTEVYSDITLYPYYINGEKYTVSYLLGKGTGTAPVDIKQYAENSYADIMSASGITAPEGKTFLYWTDGSNAYYPGDKVKVTANLKLTAVYGDTAQKTSITYHSNYPAGSGLTEKTSSVDGKENNTAITLEKAGFAAPAGYYFAHWKDAGGKQYEVGTEIGIDNTSANHLYAVWEQKKEITLKANSGTFTYDGSTHSAAGVETDTLTINGVSYTVSGYTTSSPEEKDAGNYPNIISGIYVVKDGSGADVTDQFTVKTENGSLTISKRTVNLKSESATKAYDGTALTAPAVTVSGDEFVAGEVSDLKATGTITNVGSVGNAIAYTENRSFKADNYEITKSEGILTITQNTASITVTAGSDTKMYDGTALTNNTYSITGLPEVFTPVVTVSGSITDAGSAENKVTSVIIRKGNEDVTSQFSGIETASGTLTVTKRTVKLTSESASKAFDGTPLTKPDVIVGGDGFVDGEISNLKAKGSITKAGSVTNTIEYTENSGFKADNYTITKDEGTLTITQNENVIVVNAKNATKTYDGTALTESDADVTGLPEGYTAKVKVTGGITDAGTADNVVGDVIIYDASGNDVTDQFKTITKNNGTLTVTKRSVTLTSESVSREYDGTALTAPNVAMTGDGFVTGEVTDLKATGTITNVGSVANTISYTEGTGFKASNYEIKKYEGTLTITVNTAVIKVTAGSSSKKYDGTALTKNEYSITGLPEGFRAVVKVSGSITYVGTAANKVASVTIWKNDKDVTGQFSGIQTADGTLTIEKRKVTLKSEDASREYDGTPLTAPAVTVSGDEFVAGEVSDLKATGTITNVGSVVNAIVYTENSSFKAGNYEITKSEGTLTITQNAAAITVNAGSDTKMYDGTALTKSTYSITGLPAGFTTVVMVSGSLTDAGTADNIVTSVVIKKGDEDVTDQFSNISKANGTLTVTKRKVTLKSEDASKAYDGIALTAPAVTVSGDGFVSVEVSNLKATGSIIKAGSTKNAIEYTENSGFKAGNYEIVKIEGTLTVTVNAAAITVTAESDSKTYDGTALTKNSYSIAGLPAGFTSAVMISGSITNAGTADNIVTSVVIKKGEEDVTDQFSSISTENGTLTVSARKVTLTSASASKMYDGTALTAPEVTVAGDGFVTGEVGDLKAAGTITDVGDVPNTITYTKKFGFKAGNYEITENLGTLSITAADISDETKFTVDSLNDLVYNGLDQAQEPAVKDAESGKALVKDTDYTLTFSEDVRNVGEVTVTVNGIGNYTGTVERTYHITPASVLIITPDAEKEYDGTPLTAAGTIEGLVNGETVSFAATGSQITVGSSENTYSLVWDGTASESNYTVEAKTGTLTVIAADISNADKFTVSQPENVVYNGLEQKQPVTVERVKASAMNTVASFFSDLFGFINADADDAILLEGTDYTLAYSDNLIDAGTVTITVTGIGNYTGTVVRTYQITPAPLTISTGSASKTYDGTALTNAETAVEGLMTVRDSITVTATGSQTAVGSSANGYSIEWGNTLAANYELAENLGTLTVNAAPAPSTTPAPSTPTPSTPAPTPYAPETGADTPYTPVTAAVPYTPYTGARTPYTPNTGRPYTPNTSDDGILRWFWMLGGSMILAAASYEALRKSRKN